MSLTEEEAQVITENIRIRNFKKGMILLSEGEISDEGYFILKCFLRQYWIINKEATSHFA